MKKGPSKKEAELARQEMVSRYINEQAHLKLEKYEQKNNKKGVDTYAVQELAAQRMEQIAERFAERPAKHIKYAGKKSVKTARKLNLVLSDLHYGADLDARLVNYPYGSVQETRRTASICRQVADYKRQYRNETELHVHIIGDIIQGKLHDAQNAADLTSQSDRALHCLIGALDFLATQFKKVTVTTSVGNHGRDAQRHPERAMQDKYDSNEFRIYRGIRHAFRHVKHVEVITPMRGYYIYDQFGMKGAMTHGDTIFQPGYPGQAVDVKRLKTQIQAFKLSKPEHRDVILVGMGHVHTAMDVDIGDATIITNGCLIPTDEYAQSIGIFNTPCRQQLWETVPGHMFGDHRLLKVGPDQDNDKSLDQIIPPWGGLES